VDVLLHHRDRGGAAGHLRHAQEWKTVSDLDNDEAIWCDVAAFEGRNMSTITVCSKSKEKHVQPNSGNLAVPSS